MTAFQALLTLATFLCTLVAGFLFAFAVVIMPGIRTLHDAAFLRTFQVIDRVIQNNQPIFMLVWIGSVLALIAAALRGLWVLGGTNRLLLIAATVLYLFCVQLPTATINIPLNNAVQQMDIDTMSAPAHANARLAFEARWNQWNVLRTAFASVVSILLILLLIRV